jgi:hypothetical protein
LTEKLSFEKIIICLIGQNINRIEKNTANI